MDPMLALMLGSGSGGAGAQLSSVLSGTGMLMRGTSSRALSTMALLGDEQSKSAARNEVCFSKFVACVVVWNACVGRLFVCSD